jgi:hypothetical protein
MPASELTGTRDLNDLLADSRGAVDLGRCSRYLIRRLVAKNWCNVSVR